MRKIGLMMLLAFVTLTAAAQKDGLFKGDPDVRIGTLKNGMTYYIRHNADPKDRAFFYIAQKVGAIQEEPNQRGLAHFLEHMCFNGTTHFPGTSLRTYLETIGVKFGADLNAYTAVDETVYNIDNVPVKVAGAIDSCLLILHDWSHDLTLDGKEIDEERGVIQEEWRSRNSANQRMSEAMMPVLHADSKYADAMPIGSMDIVMNFPHQALRDYYVKWYRPDLQAVIVVGDIDVDEIEKKIKTVFKDIPKPKKNAAKREYYPVPDNPEPIVFIGTDKEILTPSVQFFFKHPATERGQKNTREYVVNNLYANMAYSMFFSRTRDIAQTRNAPFNMAYVRDGSFFLAQTARALQGIVACHNGNGEIERGTEAFLRELFRVRQHGFTQTEFDRYRKDVLVGIEKALKEKDKRRSSTFVSIYVRNFLDAEPIIKLEDEVDFWRETLPQLTVNDLNRYFNSLFTDDESNMIITLTAPQNDTLKLPTKDELLALYQRIKAEKQEPYIDKESELPFLPVEPVPGKIVSETTDADGYINMELSNGMKVIIKKTDFKKDEILMQAMAHGGASLLPADKYRFSSLLNMITSVGGWGNYSVADMGKKFTGITANVGTGIDDISQSVAGSCSPKDIRYLLERAHAAFLYPRKDPEAFGALIDRLKRGIKDNEGQPNKVYGDSLRVTYFGNNPYVAEVTVEDCDSIDYDELLALYKERFSDASNFTMTFVGNVDVDSLRPWLEKYIASLPSTYRHETAKPVLDILPGSRDCIFGYPQETPKATITLRYIAPGEFSLRNQLVSSILGQVLTIIYTKTIREEAGAAYSVGAGCSVDYFPKERYSITVRFPTDPKTCDLALSLVDKGIDDLIENGPEQADIDKAKEYMLKVNQSNRTVNSYWQQVLSYRWNHGIDISKGYEDLVKSITAKDIQDMARIIRAGDRVAVVMTIPE